MDRHSTTLSLAHLGADPGTRTFGMVAVDLGATTVDIPIVLVNGATAGPRVGVTAGIRCWPSLTERPTPGRQDPGIVVASLAGVVLPSRMGRPPTGSMSSKMTPNGSLPWQSWLPASGAIEKVTVSALAP